MALRAKQRPEVLMKGVGEKIHLDTARRRDIQKPRELIHRRIRLSLRVAEIPGAAVLLTQHTHLLVKQCPGAFDSYRRSEIPRGIESGQVTVGRGTALQHQRFH